MSRECAINKLMELFKNNEELFNETIEKLDSYNGYLGDNRYYPMEDLNEFYSNTEPLELLNRVFYGHDEYGELSEFNPNREYFTYNGYGNLVSSDTKDYSAYLDEYFIESLIDNASSLYLDDEVQEIIDEIE